MFSSRLHWDFRANRLTEALSAKRNARDEILDLTESNPTHAGFEYSAAILDALRDPSALSYDPAPAGLRRAREAVSEYYALRGDEVSPDRILLTASTSEAYAYLFKLLANPGDAVLVPRPSYPLFDYLAALESVTVRHYSLHYDGGWSIEADIDPKDARAIVLVNPNNPTGSFVKRAELARLASRGVPLISDEVFSDYGFTEDPRRARSLVNTGDCLSFSMSGLSKVAGLPQMKLGWIVVNGPPALRREAMERLEWIADTYLSVSAPVQCATARLLQAGCGIQAQIRKRTAENLAIAKELLAESPVSILNVEGGWYITLRIPRTRGEEEWALDLLNRENVLVQPGFFYDFESEAYLVVSLLTPNGPFREGMARLKRIVAI